MLRFNAFRFTARSASAAAFALTLALWCSPARSQPLRLSFTGPPGDPAYDAEAVEVAYNPVQNTYLVIWSADDDGGGQVEDEFEIFVRTVDPALEPVGGILRVSDYGPLGDPAFDAVEPDVAYNPDTHEYLVVWATRAAGLAGPLFGQRLDAATGGQIGDEFELTAGMRAETPAVAYNPVTGEYLVVWSSDDSPETAAGEMEIFVRRLAGSTATPLGGGAVRISRIGPDLDRDFKAVFPDVAADATTGRYGVVWIARHVDDDPLGQVHFQGLTGLGVEIGMDDRPLSSQAVWFWRVPAPPAIAHNPRAGAAGEYLVVWTQVQAEPTLSVLGARIHGLTLLPFASGDHLLSGSELGAGAVVAARSDTGGWAVAWMGEDAGLAPFEQEIFVSPIRGAGEPGPKIRISDARGTGDPDEVNVERPAIAAGASDTVFVVWTGEDDQGGMVEGEYEAFGRTLSISLPLFADGFESGSTGAWTAVVGE